MSTDNLEKHTHKNPVQKFLIFLFYRNIIILLKKIHPESILDVGCGEGFTLARLKQQKIGEQLEGIEYNSEAIKAGKKLHPDLKITKGSIYKVPYKNNSFDLVICTEVLEHLEDPQSALKEIIRVSNKYLLLSVPNEPFFMIAQLLRGKNWSRWGNDIEHINHWSFFSFKSLISKHLQIRSIRVPLFWTIILASKI